MSIEGCFVGIDLDEQEQSGVLALLMDIEALAARLLIEADAGMTQQTIAKFIDDIRADLEVSGVKKGHG